MSWGRRRRPAGNNGSWARTSSPGCMTFSPGATGRRTSRVPSGISLVYSTITTAVAPLGSMPPVAMRQASPGPHHSLGLFPHGHRTPDGQVLGQPRGSPEAVSGPDRVAIHAGPGKSGHVLPGGKVLGLHPPHRVHQLQVFYPHRG